MKKYLQNAPRELVQALKSGEIRNGRRLLENLLSSVEMEHAWDEISKSIVKLAKDNGVPTKALWNRVWQAIAYAKLKGNKGRKFDTPGDERDRLARMANKIRRLAEAVESSSTDPDANLDVLIYDLLDDGLLRIYGLQGFHDLSHDTRHAKACAVLETWPSISELLQGLAKRADQLSRDVFAQSLTKRDRSKNADGRNREVRAFVLQLGREFKVIFGNKMYKTVAAITQVALSSSKAGEDVNITKSFVQGVLRGV